MQPLLPDEEHLLLRVPPEEQLVRLPPVTSRPIWRDLILLSLLFSLQLLWLHHQTPDAEQVCLSRVRIPGVHATCSRVRRVSSERVFFFFSCGFGGCCSVAVTPAFIHVRLFCRRAFQEYYQEHLEYACPTEDIYLE